MIPRVRWSPAMAGVFVAIHAVALSASPVVDETVLVDDVSAATLNLSLPGGHIAAVVPKGSRYVVIVDGEQGPRFDVLQRQMPEYEFTGTGYCGQIRQFISTGDMGIAGGGAGGRTVIFSSDGAHWAYAGMSGDDAVLMHDGNEAFRSAGIQLNGLAFAGGGKRLVAFGVSSTTGQGFVIVDGKAGPLGADVGNMFFTPDGAHFAYGGQNNDAQGTRWTVVDGRQVKFIGELVGFLPNGALLSRASANGVTVLIANGKPFSQVSTIDLIKIDPVSGRLVIAATPMPTNPPQQLPKVITVNGQILPGLEGAEVNSVWFSPDGKRYAIYCQRFSPRMESFMVVDGKREPGYQMIQTTGPYAPSFSPDSSKFIYLAMSPTGQTFVIVNGEESDGVQSIGTNPTWSSSGAHLAWGGVNSAGKQLFLVDDRKLALPGNSQPNGTFQFSPDGLRTTWSTGNPDGFTLVVDGKPVEGVVGTGFVGAEPIDGRNSILKFSPDSRHTAYNGRDAADNSKSGLWVDGKLVVSIQYSKANRVAFSPDSQHVFWAMSTLKANQGAYRVFVDGEEAVTFLGSSLDLLPQSWVMGADGVLTFFAIEDGTLKRFRVSPGPGSSIDAMLTRETVTKPAS